MKIQALASILVLSITTVGCATRNTVIEIPENYQGWVAVRYAAQDCGRAEKGGFFQSVVEIQASGEGCSTQWQGLENLSAVLFYYVDSSGQRKRRLKASGWGEGGEIWGEANNSDRKEYFVYVGPEASFRHAPPRPKLEFDKKNAAENESSNSTVLNRPEVQK